MGLIIATESLNMECYCGKTFYQQNAFSNHQRCCKSSRNRLTSALSKAQQIWARKRETRRLKHVQEAIEEHNPGPETSTSPNVQLLVDVPPNDPEVVPVEGAEHVLVVRYLYCS